MVTHYDLFSGIGGFSLAIDEVFKNETIKHIFCEWESFPTAVLKKHWPDAEYWGDIADLVAHTKDSRLEGRNPKGHTSTSGRSAKQPFSIVTGGFPCQPFSAAGRRRGTADDRYKWPEMFAVIKNVKPDWVVAENVRGLVTWNDGMVLEQVCTDLESIGYEVQPLIIPAVAVNAPHRRDRVWIIANRSSERRQQITTSPLSNEGKNEGRPSKNNHKLPSKGEGDWSRNWQEVAFTTCNDTMDDGIPRIVDGVPISRAKWRKESLKAYGNAIVPQVAVEVMRAIRSSVTT